MVESITKFPHCKADYAQLDISLGSVDQVKRELEHLSAVVEVAQSLCEKSVSDELILAGIRRLFDAHAVVAKRDRQITPLCALPRFDRDHPSD